MRIEPDAIIPMIAATVAAIIILSVPVMMVFQIKLNESFWLFVGGCSGFLFGVYASNGGKKP